LIEALKRRPILKDSLSITHARFFSALMLYRIIDEDPIENVSISFGHISRGNIQALQTSASSFGRTLSIICEKLFWRPLALLLSHFAERIALGARGDIVELMKIEGMRIKYARILVKQSIRDANSLFQAGVESLIAAIFSAGESYKDREAVSEEADKIFENVNSMISSELL
jgi:replicative superfamily II helicase